MDSQSPTPPDTKWLIRLPAVFAPFEPEILRVLEAQVLRRLGREFLLIETPSPALITDSAAAPFISWRLPIHHAWPCQPFKTSDFIEKAAQALAAKFVPLAPQGLWVSSFTPDSPNPRLRTLASNLRGRTLQLLPAALRELPNAEAQDAETPSVFCLLGTEGLFAGLTRPRAANGFYPGGFHFIKQRSTDTISRAGAKLAGALHHLHLFQSPPPPQARWLELGASPGGMTAELLNRGYQVTAIDRAPLDPRILDHPKLTALQMEVARFQTPKSETWDAILCDLNGEARHAMRLVTQHAPALRRDGLVIFTVKLPHVASFQAVCDQLHETQAIAQSAGLVPISTTHLEYNRFEFTLILRAEA